MSKEKFSDRGYRKLFSHPRMVEDLLRYFVREDFVSEIDFTSLKRRSESYVTDDFRKQESDIVWEVKARGRDAYIYLLMEFQSTVDHWMALRLLTYILLFYQDLTSEKKIRVLPPVFPIVLYNGDARWDAPENIEDLIDVPFPSLARYVPRFRYYKIAENEFSEDNLVDLQSLVSALFRIENSEIGHLTDVVCSIARIYEKEASGPLKRDFLLWLRRLLSKKALDPNLTTLEESEVRLMLTTKLEKFETDILLKGRAQGHRASAKVLLESRFGSEGLALQSQVDAEESIDKLTHLIRLVAQGWDVPSIRQELWPA